MMEPLHTTRGCKMSCTQEDGFRLQATGYTADMATLHTSRKCNMGCRIEDGYRLRATGYTADRVDSIVTSRLEHKVATSIDVQSARVEHGAGAHESQPRSLKPEARSQNETARKLANLGALMGLLLSTASTGCSGHIAAYEPKRRNYEPPVVAQPKVVDPNTAGSLMTGALGTSLFTDVRSFGVGDLITIRVMEDSRAERETETDMDRSSNFNTGFDAAGGLASLVPSFGTLDPSKLVYQNTDSGHKGGGKTKRRDRVRFIVTAAVRKVLPNGDLFIEGDRIVKVNDEEHHYYVSGVARAADVDGENAIVSTKLAEAEIEFYGEGALSDKQRQGWLMRALDWIWPF